MRFRQIFVTINMLMDHTASGAIIPQIDGASHIRNTGIASPTFRSTGVVLSPSDERLHQQQKEADQLEAQAMKAFGSPSVTIKHRKLQEGPPAMMAPGTPTQGITSPPRLIPGLPGGEKFDPDPPNYANYFVVGAVAVVGFIAAVGCCLCRNARIPCGEENEGQGNLPGAAGGKR